MMKKLQSTHFVVALRAVSDLAVTALNATWPRIFENMRSTLNDVAREAGVSTATVDRVLNNRSGVRGRTRDIVVETARRLGYISEGPKVASDAKPLGPHVSTHLDFVLPEGPNMYVRALQYQLEAQAAAHNGVEVRTSSIEGFNPDTLK